MKLETAYKQIQKDAEFLGMTIFDMLLFIKDHPLAQTQKTMEAYRVVVSEGAELINED